MAQRGMVIGYISSGILQWPKRAWPKGSFAHPKDVAIQIGLSNSAEEYKFPHTIGATSSMISGQNRPNETSYPNVHNLRCPYNSTMAF